MAPGQGSHCVSWSSSGYSNGAQHKPHMIGPSSICLGVSWRRRGSGWHAHSTATRRPPRLAGLPGPSPPWSSPPSPPTAGAVRAGQVDQEREPGRVDPGRHLGVGVVGGLAVQGAVRPAGDLVGHVGAAQAQLGGQGDEPLVVVAVPGGAGVFDAAPGGQGVGGLVQHDLHDRPAPGGQQLPGDEQLGGARLVLAVEDPPFGPVVAAQLVALGVSFWLDPAPVTITTSGTSGCWSWMAAQACSRAAMIRLPCCSMVLGSVMAAVLSLACACQPDGQGEGWGPRAGWGRLLPARDSWPRGRRGSARKGGASRCFPRSVWKGSWGALAGGGAGPYAARPPPGTALSPETVWFANEEPQTLLYGATFCTDQGGLAARMRRRIRRIPLGLHAGQASTPIGWREILQNRGAPWRSRVLIV